MDAIAFGNGRAVIALRGALGTATRMAFHESCDALLERADVRVIEVDLRKVESLRAEAIGMLLLLRDRAAKARVGITLRLVPGRPLDMLRAMGLERSFSIQVNFARMPVERLWPDVAGRFVHYRVDAANLSPDTFETERQAIIALSASLGARRVLLDCSRHAPPVALDFVEAVDASEGEGPAWRVALLAAAGCPPALLSNLLEAESCMRARQQAVAVFQDESEAALWLMH
jgi:anti-anti-sigma regulatory factor